MNKESLRDNYLSYRVGIGTHESGIIVRAGGWIIAENACETKPIVGQNILHL